MLNKKEQLWLDSVQKALNACPVSLKARADSYTIGDADITIFDNDKYIDKGKDVCVDVDESGAKLATLVFPFGVWSTSG